MYKVVSQKEHFFNEQQKKVKQEIMEKLMDGFFITLNDNKEHFLDAQALLDLLFSILVMFNRDVMSHFFINLGISQDGSKIMRSLFEAIREEVVKKIKLATN